jgi:hypothetical protein
MSFRLKINEADVSGAGKFENAKGHTECVEFVRQATGAPPTIAWKQGVRVEGAALGSIPRGTAIATFDDKGNYPHDTLGRHAAVYLSQDARGIVVLDQWNAQGEVKQRLIPFHRPAGTKRSNDGSAFYVIEQK